jgi:hypothetical protein
VATTTQGTSAYELFGTTSPVTGSAPTLSTDGQPIQDLIAMTVVVDAGLGVTLSGTGTLQCYIYDAYVGAWARAKFGDLTVDDTSRAQVFNAFTVLTPRNARIKWVPNAVTFAGGGSGGVTVRQLGYSRSARGQYP